MSYDVGDIAIATLTVSVHDETTQAAVIAKGPDGSETPLTPSSVDVGATWTVQVPLTMAGTWYVIWTVTGTGTGTQSDTIEAEPLPPPTVEQDDVRLLIADTSAANRIFSTKQIAAFLRMNRDNVRRAAAQALDVMAANEAMVSKVIRTQDLSTDGAKVADSLRKQAAELRRQEDQGENDSETSGFEIVEYEPYPCWPERTGY